MINFILALVIVLVLSLIMEHLNSKFVSGQEYSWLRVVVFTGIGWAFLFIHFITLLLIKIL